MANALPSGLTAVTTVEKEDLLVVQKDGETSVKKVTCQNAPWSAHGCISVSGNVTAESTTDATPRKIAAWDTDGASNNATNDSTTNNNVTVTEAGLYFVGATVSFSGTASKTFLCEIYKQAAGTGARLSRKLGAGGDVGAAAITTLVTCAAGDALSVYHWSSDGGTAFTMTDGTLTVFRVM